MRQVDEQAFCACVFYVYVCVHIQAWAGAGDTDIRTAK